MSSSRREARRFLMSPNLPVWNIRTVSLITLFYISSLVLLPLVVSLFPSCLLFCSWPSFLTTCSLNSFSTLVGGMCSLCCHMTMVLAFMHLYSILHLRLLLSILIYKLFNLVLKRQTETVSGTSISYLYLPFFFLNKSNTTGTNFRIICVCYVDVLCMF